MFSTATLFSHWFMLDPISGGGDQVNQQEVKIASFEVPAIKVTAQNLWGALNFLLTQTFINEKCLIAF